ncbi:MAG: glycosyl transferase, family 2 [Bacilli bacterium]|nr:glycosyl transferase, family 2 [Bacilli bacterium]
MFVSVIIATKDRYQELHNLVISLTKQSHIPDELVIVDSSETNIVSFTSDSFEVKYIPTDRKGISVQRNIGIRNADVNADIVLFLDDDMLLERDYLKVVVRTFQEDTQGLIGGINGFLLQNGSFKTEKPSQHGFHEIKDLYGCNMAFRAKVIKNVWFDEKLALYSWLEDWDFSTIIGRTHKLVRCYDAFGYHMQSPAGRVNGMKLGYMQLANRYYLNKKHGLGVDYMQFAKHIIANLLRSYKITYFERFCGNMRALFRVIVLGKDI